MINAAWVEGRGKEGSLSLTAQSTDKWAEASGHPSSPGKPLAQLSGWRMRQVMTKAHIDGN